MPFFTPLLAPDFPRFLRMAFMAAVAGILLSGCATAPTGPMSAALPPNVDCCTSYPEMKYADLKMDNEQAADLVEKTPVHEFLEGKSYYSAFTLPARTGPAKLKFKAFVGGVILPYATVVRPYFVFLDGSKNDLSLVPDPPVFNGTDFFKGSFFKGEVPVPQEAAYVIVYTSERPVMPLTIYSENGIAWPAKPSMTGSVRITMTK